MVCRLTYTMDPFPFFVGLWSKTINYPAEFSIETWTQPVPNIFNPFSLVLDQLDQCGNGTSSVFYSNRPGYMSTAVTIHRYLCGCIFPFNSKMFVFKWKSICRLFTSSTDHKLNDRMRNYRWISCDNGLCWLRCRLKTCTLAFHSPHSTLRGSLLFRFFFSSS